MIRSMTGFGRSHIETEHYAVQTEVRTVNNKTMRISFRLADALQGLESQLEKQIRAAIGRGTVTLTITVDNLSGEPGYDLDAAVLNYYRDAVSRAGKALDVNETVPLSVLVTLPGVIKRAKTLDDIPDELADAVDKSLAKALAALVEVREKEGRFVWDDMTPRCRTILEIVDRIEKHLPQMIEDYRSRLSERLAVLLAGLGSTVTEDDVGREVALFADRSDISEEISRMRSHVDMLLALEEMNEPCGRRLEFIAQEMFREANTMGSKANAPEITRDVVEIKAEIEKLREQALNVE